MKWRKDVNEGVLKSFRDSSRNIPNPEVAFTLCVPWFLEELSKHEMSLVLGIVSFWLEMVLSFCAGNYALWGSWCRQKESRRKKTLWSFVNMMGWTARMKRLCERVHICGHFILKLGDKTSTVQFAISANMYILILRDGCACFSSRVFNSKWHHGL